MNKLNLKTNDFSAYDEVDITRCSNSRTNVNIIKEVERADYICQKSTYCGAELYLFFYTLKSLAQYLLNLSK